MSQVESVAAAFASYRQHVIPPDAPPIQVEECRRAFYAGSYAMLMNVAANIGDASTSEEDGITQLEGLQAECEAFLRAQVAPPPPAVVEHGGPIPLNEAQERAVKEWAADDRLW